MTIYQIAVPIYRTVTLEQQLLENHNHPDNASNDHPNNVLAEMNADALAELAAKLAEGFTVLDKYDTTNRQTTYRAYVLHKFDEKPLKVENVWAEINLASNIEKCETFSKSTNQTFNFWRLGLIGGDKVNVFNHPDNTRNTFKLAEIAGWSDKWQELEIGRKFWLKNPIPLCVVKEGEWLKLTQIYPYLEWSTVSEWELTLGIDE